MRTRNIRFIPVVLLIAFSSLDLTGATFKVLDDQRTEAIQLLVKEIVRKIDRDDYAEQVPQIRFNRIDAASEETSQVVSDQLKSMLKTKHILISRQSANRLTGVYKETDEKWFFQTERIKAELIVTLVINGKEHAFKARQVIAKDNSPITIVIRLAIFLFVVFLGFSFGRRGFIYEWSYRSFYIIVSIVTFCLTIGGLW